MNVRETSYVKAWLIFWLPSMFISYVLGSTIDHLLLWSGETTYTNYVALSFILLLLIFAPISYALYRFSTSHFLVPEAEKNGMMIFMESQKESPAKTPAVK